MAHLRIVGKYPKDHYEQFDVEWSPDLTIECGSRYRDENGNMALCAGVSVFTGSGNTNSPPGYWWAYAEYKCQKCGSEMGFPTKIPTIPNKGNALYWNGARFIQYEEL